MKLSNWLFKQPLKFAALTFAFSMVVVFFYGGFFILRNESIRTIPLMIIIFITAILCGIKMIKSLPKTNLAQQTFTAIHNAQTILYSLGIFLSSVVFIGHIQQTLLKLLYSQEKSTLTTFIILSLLTIFFLYLFGLYTANIYAKFRRIRSFDIPAYKIILSMPFGFSALWAPGYILPDDNKTSSTEITAPKWYKNFNKKILSSKTNCILSFILISIGTGIFFNFGLTLLTIIFALFFGTWALQVGAKKFIKTINGTYTNIMIAINIILIILLFVFSAQTPMIAPDIQVNITETTTATTITPGTNE